MELCSFLTLDSFITDPLTHEFMRKALLMSSLVAAVCGFLSSYLTLKGWALMGDAVSHSVMPGVVVAYALGLPFSLGAFIFGVCLLYTSPSPRDGLLSRMPSSA